MQCCRLRALDSYGCPHIFTLADAPVRIFEDTFILANRTPSPFLTLSTVVRVMDHLDIGEGDVVSYRGVMCTVTYNRGFQLVSEKGTVYPSNCVPSCNVISVGTRPTSQIQFKSPNISFQLYAVLGCYEGKVVTAHDPNPCDPELLQISAGFVYKRQKLFYGDMVDGYPLIMWRGRPCVHMEEGYVEIPTHFFLGKES